MDLETRVKNLEDMMASIVNSISNNQFYINADIAGVRQNVSEINEAMFPEWDGNGYDYFASEKVTYDGQYYRCIQNHKSQSDWTPDVTPALWALTSDPGEEWPEWKQPIGASDAYEKGAKVSHNDKHWISDVDANVWEPGVYGWTEV